MREFYHDFTGRAGYLNLLDKLSSYIQEYKEYPHNNFFLADISRGKPYTPGYLFFNPRLNKVQIIQTINAKKGEENSLWRIWEGDYETFVYEFKHLPDEERLKTITSRIEEMLKRLHTPIVSATIKEVIRNHGKIFSEM